MALGVGSQVMSIPERASKGVAGVAGLDSGMVPVLSPSSLNSQALCLRLFPPVREQGTWLKPPYREFTSRPRHSTLPLPPRSAHGETEVLGPPNLVLWGEAQPGSVDRL